MKTLDGVLFFEMVGAGAANLKAHVGEVNDLNVFPIPDGDTGDNMLMTVLGGACVRDASCEAISKATEKISSGMLLSARGNSGVILSQLFEGIKDGFSGMTVADAGALGEAFSKGVSKAYQAVMTPTEGTILTVMREATEYARAKEAQSVEDFLRAFIDEAKRSLERTPELLPVLKKAGVVDSGGAGLIYIVEGMLKAALGERVGDISYQTQGDGNCDVDIDAFDENSVLEFGYCTELLLRLQTAKTNVAAFDVNLIIDYLQTIGDSIVAVKNGSIVKLHVHTMMPYKVLEFCQAFGEFLKVKIENMSLQHNSAITEKNENNENNESNEKAENSEKKSAERKKYGVVAVACGEGVKNMFFDRGADVVVDGGQSMNPSAEAFIEAFDEANADIIFVFPNNGNIVLTAQQAARLYKESEVHVIESTTVGAGYVALSMLDTTMDSAEDVANEMREAMEGVLTVEVSHCVRDAVIDGKEIHTGDYIGFVGKQILALNGDRRLAACESIACTGFEKYDACIIIYGKDANEAETEEIQKYIASNYRGKEVYVIDGGQDVYDYIMIIQ